MDNTTSNFVRTMIERDLAEGRVQQVVTRFPPEPNGYPHIGHAKAICVNFGLAESFNGLCNLRMDDTNPNAEKAEYVEAMKTDIAWLGFDWADRLFFASDYYDTLYRWAQELVRQGKAYVCGLSFEELRAYRGDITTAGKASPDRDREPEESLTLLDEMRRGLHDEGTYTLRAKIDMAHPNMQLRDPLMYRIMKVSHHRTGDAWSIYPMYDYAHGLSDAIEGVTHSLCTLEFENNRPLYDWYVQNLKPQIEAFHGGKPRALPYQTEYARLEIEYVLTSKRKLRKLVDDGAVTGWDDPRMPTLSGLRKRGVPPKAVRLFCDRVGLSKANSQVELAMLDHTIREVLEEQAQRAMAVLNPLEVIITSWEEGVVDEIEASLWPRGSQKQGTRKVPFTRVVYIEKSDFELTPSKGFRRLTLEGEVRLRNGYIIKCTGTDTDEAGEVIRLHCTHDPNTRSGTGTSKKKVKGTIHWVSAEHGRPMKVALIEPMFTVKTPGADWEKHLNPNSMVVMNAIVEPHAAQLQAGEHVQFERLGYFYRSEDDQFIRTVSLKDSWGKPAKEAKAAPPKKATKKPKAPKRKGPALPDLTDSQKEISDRLRAQGASVVDAALIATTAGLVALHEAAVALNANPKTVSRLVANDVRSMSKRATAAQVASLATLLHTSVVSTAIARDVLAVIEKEGGDPKEIVTSRGWTVVSDEGELTRLLQEVMADNEAKVQQVRAGKTRLIGFFIGQVMKKTGGRADAAKLQQLAAKLLTSA